MPTAREILTALLCLTKEAAPARRSPQLGRVIDSDPVLQKLSRLHKPKAKA